ncbi:MAG: ribonuclease J, partial [Zetaproteobacteria bacterium]
LRPPMKRYPALGRRVQTGPFRVEALPVTHSIMDAACLALQTPLGLVVHTGDFRFDPTPIDGRATPLHRLAQWGDEGVLLLASDSTNATRPGAGPSERVVGPALRQAMAGAKGRVFVTTFASNMFRVQQILDAAASNRRKVALVGHGLERAVKAMMEIGRLRVRKGLIVSVQEAAKIEPQRLVVIATGSQGERFAGLTRIARGEHPQIKMESGDLVIFSSSIVPGNERQVAHLMDHIYRRGARVVHAGHNPSLHVSGHAYAHELKTMIQLVRPRYFMPVHGEYRYLVEHRELALASGIPYAHTVIAENGQSVVVDEKGIRLGERFAVGAVLVDAESMEAIDRGMLRDRRKIAEEGMITAIVLLSMAEGKVIGTPQLVERGALQEDAKHLLEKAAADLAAYLEEMDREAWQDIEALHEDVRLFVRRWIKKRTGRRPLVVPVVIEV